MFEGLGIDVTAFPNAAIPVDCKKHHDVSSSFRTTFTCEANPKQHTQALRWTVTNHSKEHALWVYRKRFRTIRLSANGGHHTWIVHPHTSIYVSVVREHRYQQQPERKTRIHLFATQHARRGGADTALSAEERQSWLKMIQKQVLKPMTPELEPSADLIAAIRARYKKRDRTPPADLDELMLQMAQAYDDVPNRSISTLIKRLNFVAQLRTQTSIDSQMSGEPLQWFNVVVFYEMQGDKKAVTNVLDFGDYIEMLTAFPPIGLWQPGADGFIPDKAEPVFKLPFTNQWIRKDLLHIVTHPGVYGLQLPVEKRIGSGGGVSTIHGATELVFSTLTTDETVLQDTIVTHVNQRSPQLWVLTVFPALLDMRPAWTWLVAQSKETTQNKLVKRLAKHSLENVVSPVRLMLELLPKTLLFQLFQHPFRYVGGGGNDRVMTQCLNEYVSLQLMKREHVRKSKREDLHAVYMEWSQRFDEQISQLPVPRVLFETLLSPELSMKQRLDIGTRILHLQHQNNIHVSEMNGEIWMLNELLAFTQHTLSGGGVNPNTLQDLFVFLNGLIAWEWLKHEQQYMSLMLKWISIVFQIYGYWRQQQPMSTTKQHALFWNALELNLPKLWQKMWYVDLPSLQLLVQPFERVGPVLSEHLTNFITQKQHFAKTHHQSKFEYGRHVPLQMEEAERNYFRGRAKQLYKEPLIWPELSELTSDQKMWFVQNLTVPTNGMVSVLASILKRYPESRQSQTLRLMYLKQMMELLLSIQDDTLKTDMMTNDPCDSIYIQENGNIVAAWTFDKYVAMVSNMLLTADALVKTGKDIGGPAFTLSSIAGSGFHEWVDMRFLLTINRPGVYELTRDPEPSSVLVNETIRDDIWIWSASHKRSALDYTTRAEAILEQPHAWWMDLFPRVQVELWKYLVQSAPQTHQQAFATYLHSCSNTHTEFAPYGLMIEFAPEVVQRMFMATDPHVRFLSKQPFGTQARFGLLAYDNLFAKQAVFQLSHIRTDEKKQDIAEAKAEESNAQEVLYMQWYDTLMRFKSQKVAVNGALLYGYMMYASNRSIFSANDNTVAITEMAPTISLDAMNALVRTALPDNVLQNWEKYVGALQGGFEQLKSAMHAHLYITTPANTAFVLVEWLNVVYTIARRFERLRKEALTQNMLAETYFGGPMKSMVVQWHTSVRMLTQHKRVDDATFKALQTIASFQDVHPVLYDYIQKRL